jgi:hypothetical protein
VLTINAAGAITKCGGAPTSTSGSPGIVLFELTSVRGGGRDVFERLVRFVPLAHLVQLALEGLQQEMLPPRCLQSNMVIRCIEGGTPNYRREKQI